MRATSILIMLFLPPMLLLGDGTHNPFLSALKQGAEASITLQIIEPTGEPVKDASISFGFYNPNKNTPRQVGLSDEHGKFTAKAICMQDVTFNIEKEGYYSSSGHYFLTQESNATVIKNKWQPWNPTWKVILRPKQKPIPMFAKSIATSIPKLNTNIGFDLFEGDWVKPYGKGDMSDFEMNVSGTFRKPADRKVSMTVNFPNPNDGLIEFSAPQYPNTYGTTEYMSDYSAPTTGYAQAWTYEKVITPTIEDRINASPREGLHLYFRIRTEVDSDGDVIKSNYGKIYGDMHSDFRDFKNTNNIGVYFTYYLNLNRNDSNIEFDPSSNLNQDPKNKFYGWRP